MNKVIIGAALLLLIGGAIYWKYEPAAPAAESGYAADHRNGTYEIEGEKVVLQDGLSEVKISPDSETKMTTRYFGNEARGDLDGDGKEDIAFILTQNGGGSGTFYYLAVALGSEKGYQGLNAILLGDRIAPQVTEIRDGQVIVNFAVRKEDEPMSAAPSVGTSLYLKVENGRLVSVE